MPNVGIFGSPPKPESSMEHIKLHDDPDSGCLERSGDRKPMAVILYRYFPKPKSCMTDDKATKEQR